MNITERDLSLVVSDIQNSKITNTTIDLMRRTLDQGLSSRLVAQATLIGSQSGQDQAQAISKTMANLETVAESDRSLACILMSDLWGFASDARMHEICDAIDLWLRDNDSVELQRHLRALASSERDLDKRRHFEQLIEGKSG